MTLKTNILKPSTKKFIVDLVNAGLIGESKLVELAALSLARSIKKDAPEVSTSINQAISSFSINGGAAIRSVGRPLPIDYDSQLEMATLSTPNIDSNVSPILPDDLKDKINGFLDERNKINLLLSLSPLYINIFFHLLVCHHY